MNINEAPALEIVDAVLELGDGDSRVRALDSVSLTVMPGELVAVVVRREPGSRRCWPPQAP